MVPALLGSPAHDAAHHRSGEVPARFASGDRARLRAGHPAGSAAPGRAPRSGLRRSGTDPARHYPPAEVAAGHRAHVAAAAGRAAELARAVAGGCVAESTAVHSDLGPHGATAELDRSREPRRPRAVGVGHTGFPTLLSQHHSRAHRRTAASHAPAGRHIGRHATVLPIRGAVLARVSAFRVAWTHSAAKECRCAC